MTNASCFTSMLCLIYICINLLRLWHDVKTVNSKQWGFIKSNTNLDSMLLRVLWICACEDKLLLTIKTNIYIYYISSVPTITNYTNRSAFYISLSSVWNARFTFTLWSVWFSLKSLFCISKVFLYYFQCHEFINTHSMTVYAQYKWYFSRSSSFSSTMVRAVDSNKPRSEIGSRQTRLTYLTEPTVVGSPSLINMLTLSL